MTVISVPMLNQCAECVVLRALLADQKALFDVSWKELLAERDALSSSIEAFQQQADRRRRGGWRAWLPWLIAAALFGAGLWCGIIWRGP